MTLLIDKLIILLCCTIMIEFNPISTQTILCLLLVIIISSLNSYFTSPFIPRLLICFYLILCFFLPYLFVFIPLLIYDIINHRFQIPALAVIPVFLFYIRDNSYGFGVFIVILSTVSILLQHRSEKLRNLYQELKALRDTSTEYNILLTNKNIDLMEKQDYEIHLATLNERNRIAREIHDNVGHMLSRSILQVGALMAINHNSEITEGLSSLNQSLSGAMDSIRTSVHDLHNDSLDLFSNINSLVAEFSSYNVDFDYDLEDNIPKNLKYCFISITKEALSNISRHSNADKIRVAFRQHPALYQLLIEDNGSNIQMGEPGIGLENIKDRVNSFKGTLTINTERGFRIFISIPILK